MVATPRLRLAGALTMAAGLLLSCEWSVSAQTTLISANPNPVHSNPGTTTVTWATADGSESEVYVSINGSDEILFAGSSSHGSQGADWAGGCEKCEFRLYAGTAHLKRLATVTVTRRLDHRAEPGQTSSPSSVEPGPHISTSPQKVASPETEGVEAVGVAGFATALVSCTCLLALMVTVYHRSRQQLSSDAAGKGIAESVYFGLRRSQWLVWLWMATVVFLVSNHALVRGLGVGLWDAEGLFYPYQVLVADHARSGEFVSWDPWSSGGLPASAEPQMGAYSPILIAIGALMGGTSAGFITYWLFVWWLGAFGIFMLGRTLRAPVWGAFVVALGFVFCGVYTGQAEHTSFIAGFSFLPLVIWRVEVAFQSRTLRPAVEAGALWGLSALAAYPGLVIVTGSFVGLWVVGRWLCRERDLFGDERGGPSAERPPLRFAVMSIGVFLLVGSIVLSPTYIAFFFDGLGTHTRVGVLSRYIAVVQGALDPGALSTFASPDVAMLKLSHLEDIWPYTDPSMVSIYAGAAIPTLALLALLRKPSDQWRWWLLLLAALSLGCALGQALPLRGWLYDWFYPMRFFRHAAMFRNYYVFAIAVLALLATRDLAEALDRRNVRIWILFVVAASLMAAIAFGAFIAINAALPNPDRDLTNASIRVGIVWFGLCTTVLLPTMKSGRWVNGIVVLLPVVGIGDALMTATISKNTIMNTGDHPMALSVERWRHLDRDHDPRIDLTDRGFFREESACAVPACDIVENDQMITKKAVFNAYSPQINLFHLEMVRYEPLRRMAVGRERMWFSRNAEMVAPTMQNFAAFRARADETGVAPLLLHPRDMLLGKTSRAGANDSLTDVARIERLPAAERVAAEVVRYEPAELVFRVRCPAAGWLLVTERWAPGWHAEVDGKPAVVLGGNFIFRALEMPAGVSEVRFWYRSSGFPWLVVASWSTLAAVGLWSCSIVRTMVGGATR